MGPARARRAPERIRRVHGLRGGGAGRARGAGRRVVEHGPGGDLRRVARRLPRVLPRQHRRGPLDGVVRRLPLDHGPLLPAVLGMSAGGVAARADAPVPQKRAAWVVTAVLLCLSPLGDPIADAMYETANR